MSAPSPFWTAYAAAIKKNLAPMVELPKDNEIFPLPWTVPFTSATTALTPDQVNNLVYNVANTTRAADGSTGKYAQELNTYLSTVDTSSLQDPAEKKELDDAEVALEAAKLDFAQVETEAKAQYDEIEPPKPPFETWALQNWPPYPAAKRTLANAQARRDLAYNKYWGRINTLHGYQDGLTKAMDVKAIHQGYNMAVRVDGQSTFVPSYSSVGLLDQLNGWINAPGQDQTFVEALVDPTAGIYVKLTTKGFGKFDVNVGRWDVPNVQALYPKRVVGAPDVLNPKYARTISFLVGYDPRLQVEVRENGKITTSTSSATTTTADGKPYATILGVLGQHFPAVAGK